MRPRLRFT
uniref:Uncharacterized protein n=1 Tax=Arundo donax TaxID=35708 RepID=A0A0A9ALG2_ARUDO